MSTDYYDLSYGDCIVFLCVSPLVYGSYLHLRNYFAPCDIMTFVTFYGIGHILEGIIVYLICGLPVVDTDLTGSDEALNVFLLMLGGFLLLIAENVIFTAAGQLQVCTTMACIGVQYSVGIICFYYLDPTGVDIYYLLVGIAIMIVGLGFVIAAEYYKDVQAHACFGQIVDADSDAASSAAIHSFRNFFLTRREQSGADRERDSLIPKDSNDETVTGWIVVGIIGAFLILVSFMMVLVARLQTNGITNPALDTLLFECGMVAAVPFVIIAFGYYDILQQGHFPNGLSSYIENIQNVPLNQKLAAVAIGCLTAIGETGLFFSLEKVPFAVSYGIIVCEVVIGAGLGILVFDDYSELSWFGISHQLVAFGVIAFALSSFVFIVYASD